MVADVRTHAVILPGSSHPHRPIRATRSAPSTSCASPSAPGLPRHLRRSSGRRPASIDKAVRNGARKAGSSGSIRARLCSLRGLLGGEALSCLTTAMPAKFSPLGAQVVARRDPRQASPSPARWPSTSTRRACHRDRFLRSRFRQWTQYAGDHRPMSWLYRREEKPAITELPMHAKRGVFVVVAEADLFRKAAPEPAERVSARERGRSPIYFARQRWRQPLFAGGPQITGAMDYWPNVDAWWFHYRATPRCAQVPDAASGSRRHEPRARCSGALAGRASSSLASVLRCAPVSFAHSDVIVAPAYCPWHPEQGARSDGRARPVVISSAPATGLGPARGMTVGDCLRRGICSRTVALLADVRQRRTMGLAARGGQFPPPARFGRLGNRRRRSTRLRVHPPTLCWHCAWCRWLFGFRQTILVPRDSAWSSASTFGGLESGGR